MRTSIVLRLLESLFRHPVLHAVPVLLALLAGVLYIDGQEPVYRSTGVVLVDDASFLAELTQVRGADGGWGTPAQLAAGELGSLLGTSAFLQDVAVGAGLVEEGVAVPGGVEAQLRSSTGTWTGGASLLHVWAEHEDAAVATSITAALIDGYTQWEIDAELAQSTVALEFLEPLAANYAKDVAEARDALEGYLAVFPAPVGGAVRPLDQQSRVNELTDTLADVTAQYRDTVSKQQSAELASAQTRADVSNRLQVVDAASIPTAPSGTLRAAAVTLLTFLALGALVAVASVVLGAVLDHTARYPDDLVRTTGLPVLSVVPSAASTTSGDGSRGAGDAAAAHEPLGMPT